MSSSFISTFNFVWRSDLTIALQLSPGLTIKPWILMLCLRPCWSRSFTAMVKRRFSLERASALADSSAISFAVAELSGFSSDCIRVSRKEQKLFKSSQSFFFYNIKTLLELLTNHLYSSFNSFCNNSFNIAHCHKY